MTATTQQTIPVHAPANGSLVGAVPTTGADEVQQIAGRLRLAQPGWQELGPKGRAASLHQLRDWILDHASTLADVLQAETGKVRHEAALEPMMSGDVINYFAGLAAGALATESRKPHNVLGRIKKLSVSYQPYPLVGVISPWNFPLVLPLMDVVPALVAGAAVIIKPSEMTPLTMQEIRRGWAEIGAPDVFACVTGDGSTGAAVVDAVDYIQFTGSTATGRTIAVRAAERLIGCGLELGGKDPMIVLADADLERAANGAAWGALFNSGQACVSIERVYVEAPVHDEFVRRLVDRVEGLRQGSGVLGADEVGAMTTEAQIELVERHVAEAVADGARVLTGGKRGSTGRFYEPTVIVDVDHTMSCIREETFGPTIPVVKVANADEAVRLANDSPYGLSASVWTKDSAKARRIAARLDVGAVNIHDALANLFAFSLPHGGWKESGIGARLGGTSAIRKYCRPKAVSEPVITPRNEMNWYPYSLVRASLLQRALRAAVATGRRRFR